MPLSIQPYELSHAALFWRYMESCCFSSAAHPFLTGCPTEVAEKVIKNAAKYIGQDRVGRLLAALSADVYSTFLQYGQRRGCKSLILLRR